MSTPLAPSKGGHPYSFIFCVKLGTLDGLAGKDFGKIAKVFVVDFFFEVGNFYKFMI